ncbi:uncharacterized protein LOC117325372 [Pecten maximus]|uniref:uncharacterized protein LOC117325372 n=1 Tax=Pecten maximus TaxID=6579 RepID=UPI0014590D77|nr:uncharacterized protein LOC117325372 [Pecten maximus]
MSFDQVDGAILSRNEPNNDETNSQIGNDENKESTKCKRMLNKISKNFWGLPVLRRVPESDHDRAFDCLIAVVSLCLCLGEVVLEGMLLYEYHMNGQHLQFSLTLGVIVITGIVVGIFTTSWACIALKQRRDLAEEREPSLNDTAGIDNSSRMTSPSSNKVLWSCRISSSFLQFGRAFRLAEYIYNMHQGWKSKRKDEGRIKRAEVELRDASILGLIEGYLETSLKLLLQLYLRFDTDFVTRTRDLFLVVALASISASVTSCYMTNRKLNHGRQSATSRAYAAYVLMRLFELGPRLILLVLCIKFVRWWTLVGVGLHLVLMIAFNTCYVDPENNDMCCRHGGNCFFSLFVSYVEIYSFINMNKDESKRTAVIYYIIFYLENALMMSLVLGLTSSGSVPCMTSCKFAFSAIPGFVFHVLLLSLYYNCLHSTRNRGDV